MTSAYEIFFNPDGSYKTSAQYEAAAARDDDLDLYTTDQLNDLHAQMFDEHTRRYEKCSALPVTHPAYPAARDAMTEIGEHMRAIGVAIKSRESEQWTEYVCMGCSSAYSAKPYSICPHKCTPEAIDA